MGIDLRQVRVSNEWKLLQEVVSLNPSLVEILDRRSGPEQDVFRVTLRQTGGVIQTGATKELVFSHTAEIGFARFFPSVPIEVHLATPVFHPNVEPCTGFVCLWNRFSPGDTVCEALYRLQHILSWSLVNLESVHVMQVDAAKWYEDPLRRTALPLSFTALCWPRQYSPENHRDENRCGTSRKRLEPIVGGATTF
jgi:hypothetical protein